MKVSVTILSYDFEHDLFSLPCKRHGKKSENVSWLGIETPYACREMRRYVAGLDGFEKCRLCICLGHSGQYSHAVQK